MSQPLPPGWETRVSTSTGKAYFVELSTGNTQYAFPASAAGARPACVRASHLLVKHAGSRRPASWREDPITRSKADALARLATLRAGIAAAPDLHAAFAAAAAEHSDCSSAAKGGDLGTFGPGAMQKAFEDGAFALRVGELSGVVDSDSGLHIILRTA
jgi:NIMA-interacting peptidyl-prolyl cis-trans isomerase 1